MTTPDADAPVVSLADEPDEDHDVSSDALVDEATSLLKEPDATSPDEKAWREEAASRLNRRFREAFHGIYAPLESTRAERKSRP
jgi:hypothetical protein